MVFLCAPRMPFPLLAGRVGYVVVFKPEVRPDIVDWSGCVCCWYFWNILLICCVVLFLIAVSQLLLLCVVVGDYFYISTFK